MLGSGCFTSLLTFFMSGCLRALKKRRQKVTEINGSSEQEKLGKNTN